MKRYLYAVLAGGLLAMVASTPALADTQAVVVVKTTEGAAAAARGTGGQVIERVDANTAVVAVSGVSTDAAVARFQSRDSVEWVEPVTTYRAAVVPNDSCFSRACAAGSGQYNTQQIGAPAAWDKTTGDSLTIAVLDSGIDASHPEFGDRVTVGPNFSTSAENIDDYGHGTHVAGILAAQGDNGSGIAGVAWNVRLLSLKVLDANGAGSSFDIAQAVRYAADHGARIINLSLVGGDSNVLREAVAFAQRRGALVVAAAGNRQFSFNEDVTVPQYPASFDDVIAVGSTDNRDELAYFSYRGPWVDILAPGDAIVSTWPSALPGNKAYEVDSGTSMSTPVVSGVAALIMSHRPFLSTQAVADRLLATATPIGGRQRVTASGRVNAAAAVADAVPGYRMAASDGGIFTYDASFDGSTGSLQLNQPIVAMVPSGSDSGYWLVARDGGVFTFNVPFHGSTGGAPLPSPIVSATATKAGRGYLMVSRAGHVYAFGDAVNFGSASNLALNHPIVSIVATASGRGYWLFASDGGVFSFGDAAFLGSTGSIKLNQPIVGAMRTGRGDGYWMVASDGGIFSFGDANFHGSTGSIQLNQPIVAMTPTATGKGYWLIASDGGVFSFGDASFRGSAGSLRLNKPVITGAAIP